MITERKTLILDSSGESDTMEDWSIDERFVSEHKGKNKDKKISYINSSVVKK